MLEESMSIISRVSQLTCPVAVCTHVISTAVRDEGRDEADSSRRQCLAVSKCARRADMGGRDRPTQWGHRALRPHHNAVGKLGRHLLVFGFHGNKSSAWVQSLLPARFYWH